mgnify:CR=1 FL=1
MIFLDSWVWLEYLLSSDRADAAESVIERAADQGGLIAPTVVTEVAYRVRVVSDEANAEEAVRAMLDLDAVECLPLVATVAEYAAALRYEYYEPGTREFSYADTIHLATAVVHDECDVLYSGDPDFGDVAEIETVIL